MAQQSLFWTTGGAGDGASPYTQAQVFDWIRRQFVNDPTTQGVAPDYPKSGAKELAATAAGTTVTIAPGAAVCYGSPYESTASEPFIIATPTIGTTGHRVVLRADWTARTVRLALKSSSNGVAALPALTQSAGTTWEIPLWSIQITTGGVVTLTDERGFLHLNTKVSAAMLDAGAATDAAIGTRTPNQATAAASGAGTLSQVLSWLANRIKTLAGTANWYDAPVASLASLHSDKLAASGGSASNLAVTGTLTNNGNQVWHAGNDGQGSGLDADLVAGVAIEPPQRQGGNATNWSTAGTTNYAPAAVRQQRGVTTATFSNSTAATVQVTFPVAFGNAPVVVAIPRGLNAAVSVASESATQCTLTLYSPATITGSYTVAWFADGPA